MALDEIAYKLGLAPEFSVFVNDIEMPQDITQFVTSLEYENTDQVVDKIQIEMMNPEFKLTNRKFLLPGNTISVYGGYGKIEGKEIKRGKLEYLGSGIVTSLRQSFPEGDMPMISITAFSKDHFMHQRVPTLDQEDAKGRGNARTATKEKKHIWGKVDYSEAVKEIASRYNFFTSDETGASTIETSGRKEYLYQVQGVTDYEFCVGLANLLGWSFWVSCDKEGRWVLHFKSPKTVIKNQEKVYTLRYNDGDNSTLITFDPEMLLTDMFTEVYAETVLPSGRPIKKGVVFSQNQQWSPVATGMEQDVEGSIKKASDIKLYMKDFAISIPDASGIKNEADLEKFVTTWIQRHENTMMLASGSCVGLELLRARQIHRIENVGTLYDGEWLFDSVRHKFSSTDGYMCEFHARKVDQR